MLVAEQRPELVLQGPKEVAPEPALVPAKQLQL